VIKSKNLIFEYINSSETAVLQQNVVLNNINISIDNGEFIAIAGRNGSGKSTLARHLNALLLPVSGTLWVKSLDTHQPEHVWDIRQSTGMVFQNPDNQLIATIVEEDVAFGPENLGVPPHEIRTRVDESLATVGMSDYMSSLPHQLSGGQKQRIAIAGVLAMKPDCIVLDEPTAMLDPSGRREVLETIKRLNRESGITIILITQFMEEAAQANRLLVMDNGQIALDDSPRNIFRQVSAMKKLGLDVPHITSLAHELLQMGIPVGDASLNVEEFLQDSLVREKIIDHAMPEQNLDESIYLTTSKSVSLTPLIETKKLTHIYNHGSVFEKKAVDSINLTIDSGEIVGLIGHTGSGKSTLIQHFNALLKPTSGSVFIDGEEIGADKKRLKIIRERVGLVFQYPEHQLFEITVYKDVAFGPVHMGLSETEVDTRVRSALELVGLSEDVYEKSPFDLSGGQKRRVAIAGILAMRPDILVLDEPAAGLDPAGRKEIFSHIKHMHEQTGITVILVSHSMDDAARLANRIIVMNQGKIVCDGPTAEVFSQVELLYGIGLAVPQISALMDKLHQYNPRIPTGVFTAGAAAAALAEYLR
jgi:energy-coupling factor transport system ATP-binding protein